MPTRKLELTTSASLRPDLKALLGPPPLLDGEDASVFDTLYESIRTAVAPRDVFEEIWARDVCDNLWETLRLRRLKVMLMRASAHEGLERLLRPLMPILSNTSAIATDWAKRDSNSVKEVDATLKKAGLDQDAITAQTLAANLDAFERIERMIMHTEARRNMILREVDRHRDVLARRLAEIATEIEDAEFREIPRGEAAE